MEIRDPVLPRRGAPLECLGHYLVSFARCGLTSDTRVLIAVNDSVAVDAKRILLRYGAPIAILDEVTEPHRIEFARAIARTSLADRGRRLRELLIASGYIAVDEE